MTDIVVGITLKADGSGFVGEVRLGKEELEKLGQAGGRAADGLKRVDRESEGVGRDLARLRQNAVQAVAAFVSFQTVASVVRQAAQEIMAFERSTANLEAVLRATGGAAGLTVAEISALADELERVTLFDDAEIKQAAAVLATFRSVSGDTFREALSLATDLAALLGGDVQSAVLMLGKALEDPTTGLTALRRAGVDFKPEQQELIKTLVDTGREAEAMGLILDQVAGQVEGVAQNQVRGLTGATNDLADAWGDLLKSLKDTSWFSGLVKALGGVADFVHAIAQDAGGNVGWEAFAAGFNPAIHDVEDLDRLLANLQERLKPFQDAAPFLEGAELERYTEQINILTRQIQVLLITRRQLTQGDGPVNPGGPSGGVPPWRRGTGNGDDDGGGASSEFNELTDAIELQIAAEQRLAAARGEGREALRQALIENQAAALIAKADVDAKSTQADRLRALAVQLVDLQLAEEEYTRTKERQAAATERATEAAEQERREREAAFERGRALIEQYDRLGETITRDVMTPQERFNETLRELDFLLQTDRISLETYDRAVKKAGDELDDATGAADGFKEGMRDVWHVIGTAAEDAAVKGEKVRGVLKGLEEDLVRIAWRVAVTKPFENAVTGIFDIDWSSVWDDIWNAPDPVPSGGDAPVMGGLFHGGGMVGVTPTPRRAVPRQLYSHAPRMHGGGPVLGPDEQAIIGKRGEIMGWPEQLRHAFGGGDVIVQNIDQRKSGDIRQEESRGPNGERIIRQFILDTVEQGIGGGRFDGAMNRAYGAVRVGRR